MGRGRFGDDSGMERKDAEPDRDMDALGEGASELPPDFVDRQFRIRPDFAPILRQLLEERDSSPS